MAAHGADRSLDEVDLVCLMSSIPELLSLAIELILDLFRLQALRSQLLQFGQVALHVGQNNFNPLRVFEGTLQRSIGELQAGGALLGGSELLVELLLAVNNRIEIGGGLLSFGHERQLLVQQVLLALEAK